MLENYEPKGYQREERQKDNDNLEGKEGTNESRTQLSKLESLLRTTIIGAFLGVCALGAVKGITGEMKERYKRQQQDYVCRNTLQQIHLTEILGGC